MTFRALVEYRNINDDGRGKTDRSCQKHAFVSVLDLLSTTSYLLGASFITSQKSNVCAALNTQNAAENNCTTSHAQNTTAYHPKRTFLVTGCERRDGRLSPEQTAAKVNSKLHSQWQYTTRQPVAVIHILPYEVQIFKITIEWSKLIFQTISNFQSYKHYTKEALGKPTKSNIK